MTEIKNLVIQIPRLASLHSTQFFEPREDIRILKAKKAVKQTLEQIASDSGSMVNAVYIKNVFIPVPKVGVEDPGFEFTGLKGKLEYVPTKEVDLQPYLEKLAEVVQPYGFKLKPEYEVTNRGDGNGK